MTQKQRVAEKLKKEGSIDNFWAVENKVTLRLGAIINVLREEGWEIDGGFIPGTKNWRYTTKKKIPKFKWIEIEKDGVKYAKQVLISGSEEAKRENGEGTSVERTF